MNSNLNKSEIKHCPYIMKSEKIELEMRKLYILFEKMDMSMSQFIKKKSNTSMSENKIIKPMMKQIMLGL